MESYHFLALGSAFSFALASLFFTFFARKLTVAWMNTFKAVVALVAFFIAYLLTKDFSQMPKPISVLCFFSSGLLGLNIADFFLVRSFKFMGPARTLMIFSFQPIFLGILSFFVFHQALTWASLVGVFFMMACIFCISYEHFHKEHRWDIAGPLIAMAGMLIDSVGILLTREAFELDPTVSVLEANFYRSAGACIGFYVLSFFYRIDLKRRFIKLSGKARVIVLAGGFLGTFIALWMYLTAVSKGHLATVSAIAGSAPVFAAIFECIVERKKPSRFLILALILFGVGFATIVRAS